MKRIIIDSQSNGLLRGSRLEQLYDQRGGLCQVGAGHLVLTTEPVDQGYLRYWEGLGLGLPRLVSVGPFDAARTLSELVLAHDGARATIRDLAATDEVRLEFYCIEEPERALAQALDVLPYCNFDISIAYAGKLEFKALCGELGLTTVPWFHDPDPGAMLRQGLKMLERGQSVLVKTETGMGGVGCGGMANPATAEELARTLDAMAGIDGALFLEGRIDPLRSEFSVHWEITTSGEVTGITVFDSISVNNSYRGTAFPATNEPELAEAARRVVAECFGPYLAAKGGRGFFCCDVLVDSDGVLYWNDFNPRKGASIYVRDLALRLSAARMSGAPACFWHEGVRLPKGEGLSVQDVLDCLGGALEPNQDSFVVLTNPGVVPFGRVDLTGISRRSRDEARRAFQRGCRSLSSYL